VALDLDSVVGLATLVALVGGLGGAYLQLRESERRRRDAQATEAVRSIQNEEAFAASRLLSALPEGLTAHEIESRGPEVLGAARRMEMVGETLGYLVYSRVVPLAVVDEMAGGSIRACWRTLRRYAGEVREREGIPNSFEWFQWLADRLEENPVAWKRQGAHVAHREWRP